MSLLDLQGMESAMPTGGAPAGVSGLSALCGGTSSLSLTGCPGQSSLSTLGVCV